MVTSSIADVAANAAREAAVTTPHPPSPVPPPDTDQSGPDSDSPPPAVAAETVQPTVRPPQAPTPKKGSKSLLRKVSTKIGQNLLGPGGAPGAARVGGPRKMNTARFFGHPPPATTEEARNRWNTNAQRKPADQPAPTQDHVEPAGTAPGDPDNPLMQALEGFERTLAEQEASSSEEDEYPSTGHGESLAVIAYGIREVLHMLRENQHRDAVRQQERIEHEAVREIDQKEQQDSALESIKAELREWEAKREELLLENKDAANQAGIDAIIVLLKDQMAEQEKAMADLKEGELVFRNYTRH